MAEKKRGEPIPEGWALDADVALSGMMLPAVDAKDSALAFFVEILAAPLTGANYSYEAPSFFEAEGKPPSVGQFVIAINPNGPLGSLFGDRLEELVGEIEGQDGARLPGTRRLASRAEVPN